jgi:hypothetical protein
MTVTLYDSPGATDSPQYLIDCRESIGVSSSVSTLFLQNPTYCEFQVVESLNRPSAEPVLFWELELIVVTIFRA